MIVRDNRLPAVRLLVRRSKWARAEAGGLLYSLVDVGDHVKKGQEIAKLMIKTPSRGIEAIPLLADRDVARLGLVGRLLPALQTILWGEPG